MGARSRPWLGAVTGVLLSLAVPSVARAGSITAWGNDNSKPVSSAPKGDDFTAISGGTGFGLAKKADGSIAAWGNDKFNQVSNAPKGNGFFAISAGSVFGLALTSSDGEIVAWGGDTVNQVSNAPKDKGYTAIAAGFSFGLALKADGSIVAWGNDTFNQVSNAPKDNGFYAISAGTYFGLALSSVPEPNSLVMVGTAVMVGLIAAWWRWGPGPDLPARQTPRRLAPGPMR